MKDIPIIAEPMLLKYVPLGNNIYFINCPGCGTPEHDARLEAINPNWDIGWKCLDCGLEFKTDDRIMKEGDHRGRN